MKKYSREKDDKLVTFLVGEGCEDFFSFSFIAPPLCRPHAPTPLCFQNGGLVRETEVLNKRLPPFKGLLCRLCLCQSFLFHLSLDSSFDGYQSLYFYEKVFMSKKCLFADENDSPGCLVTLKFHVSIHSCYC